MSLIDEPNPRPSARAVSKTPVAIPEPENWVGWCLRPHSGGWKLRRVLIPKHVLEMVATDKDTPANRRELVVAQVATEVGAMNLITKTPWGAPFGLYEEPGDTREMVEMLSHYTMNALGRPVPIYRPVPKEAWDALPDEAKLANPLRTP